MKFYHQGKRKTNEPGMASGCLMLIGFGAILFLFFMLEDMEDVKEYLFEIILALLVGIGLLVALYSKKGKLSNHHITIKNHFFSIEKVNIPLDKIILDVYFKNESFRRYHLRDEEGKVAVFSVFKDDLLAYFLEHLPDQVVHFEETQHKHNGPYIVVNTQERELYYDLDSGKYRIFEQDKPKISFLPDVYTYDGNYKMGKPLGSKFTKK